ncbi:unnamed protein product [Orchesella dallaii]|uniref:BUB1 N-terminal domain-containing protein n=1 Tax=Orchesella dallaii TaxID=48710 RepID=A0ABP1Q5Y3_9HEXA
MSSGGWELSKENIQPLSSGRRMAYLAESLPAFSGANDQQQEAHHWEQIGKLEEIAGKQAGDDPLQAWIDLIRYIQQHFPVMNAKVNAKFKDAMRKAVQLNINNDNYRNDRRYVELVLKSVEVMPDTFQQLKMLRYLLEDGGIGDLVSSMYIRLSEIYEAQGDEKNASEILRKGIQKNAEPKCSLEEMLTHIQNRWAEKYAKTLEEGSSGDFHGMRNFASSVPTVGRNNEAITIRRDLPPAAPATDRHNNKMPSTRVHVYNEENVAPNQVNERDNLQQNAATNSLFSVERADYDRENHMEPTRWNTGSTHLDNPAIPEPPEKLKLFEEEPVSHYPASKLEKPHEVSKRALKERTEVTEETHPQLNTDSQNPSKPDYQSRNVSGISHARHNDVDESQDFDKKDVFEDIKYKPLVPGRRKVNRMMMKAITYLKKSEEKQKQAEWENNEKTLLRREVEKLKENVKILEEKLKDQVNLNDLKLMQKEEKIKQLEYANENLTSQLTQCSTSNNIRESQFHREKNCLVEEINELKSRLKKSDELENELNYYKKQYEALEEKMAREAEVRKDNTSDYEHVVVEKKPTMVNVDVQRNVNYVSSSSGEQCTAEISRFHSGDNTIAANSFLPDLGNANSICYNQSVHERKGLADNLKGNDMMMNITPVAPPDDFDIPPPSFNNFGIKKLSLYESVSESFSKPNPYKVNLFANTKRNDVMKSLHMLPENLPPQPQVATASSARRDPMGEVEPAFVPHEETTPEQIQINQNFLRPVLPSRKSIVSIPRNDNVRSTAETASNNPVSRDPVPETYYSSQRRYYGANGNDSDSDEEIMIRRHQQTGVDLNISNLTCALSLGPRPLTNSTPEKIKNLPTNNFQLYTEEPAASDIQNGASRMLRYNSVLNDPDPAINLSTIQETSHENRSRSTTSSSSGNYTASTTRFGMATSTTQFYNNITRSSSIPRSNSHMSQLYSNGYHSDTNGK